MDSKLRLLKAAGALALMIFMAGALLSATEAALEALNPTEDIEALERMEAALAGPGALLLITYKVEGQREQREEIILSESLAEYRQREQAGALLIMGLKKY